MHRTTTVAALEVDTAGKPIVSSWLPWEPSCELRWTNRGLQQQWSRLGISSLGFVINEATEYEWRLVPTVNEE